MSVTTRVSIPAIIKSRYYPKKRKRTKRNRKEASSYAL